MNWIHLAWYWIQVQFLVNTVINVQTDKWRKFRHQLYDYQILSKDGAHRELS